MAMTQNSPETATSVGVVERHYLTFAEPPNELHLQSGEKLGPITLAYETYGKLNQCHDNAILILHALSGDAHVAGYHDRSTCDCGWCRTDKPGWWDEAVGPGKAFDTERYFVICSNVIGGCQGSTGPSSINPATGRPYGLAFPVVSIADMVRAQRYLLDHLGIERLLAVVGGSMGGMQALQWAVAYPERVGSCVLLATTARHSAQSIAFNEVARQAIYADPNWCGGSYYSGNSPDAGLALARMIGHITYLSEASMKDKFGRRLQNRTRYGYDFHTEFAVESYLQHQGNSFTQRFDANSLLYISKAIDYFDISVGYRSLEDALASVKARCLVISYTSDWLYPSTESKEIVHALLANGTDVTYVEIESNYGHDSFLLEVEPLKQLAGEFIAYTHRLLAGNGAPSQAAATLAAELCKPVRTGRIVPVTGLFTLGSYIGGRK